MIDKSDAQKAREVQDKPSYRRNCSICVRSFYDSLVGPCPERDGRQVCMYCCRMCENSYKSRLGGWACRVKDAARKKGKKPAAAGVPHPSPAGDTFPEGEAGKEKTA